ncbi:hypothetical protein HY839_03290 [Candidatus Azambacteria bacterium]|nr:hypothetical protein [Candidatus Azambacteria bacterium]
MAQNYSREINKTKIIIIFFIVFSAVAAYAATQLLKTVRPMTLEEYERYDGRRPAQAQTFFDAFMPFSIQ